MTLTERMARFWVPGIARGKGSMNAVPIPGRKPMVGKGGDRYYRIRDIMLKPQGKHLAAWTRAVQAASLEQRPSMPLDGPWELSVVVYLPRAEHALPLHPELHTSAAGPDGDKLLRAICDALESIYWTNDGHISDKSIKKRWEDERGPGADIMIRRLQPQQTLFE